MGGLETSTKDRGIYWIGVEFRWDRQDSGEAENLYFFIKLSSDRNVGLPVIKKAADTATDVASYTIFSLYISPIGVVII